MLLIVNLGHMKYGVCLCIIGNRTRIYKLHCDAVLWVIGTVSIPAQTVTKVLIFVYSV